MSELVWDVTSILSEDNLMLATAESCTGGLIATLMTDQPGSSRVFERGFVTYSNMAKEELLGVSSDILREFGAVSPECAKAMASGALNNSHAHISLSVTGIAGPGGETPTKPLGLVYIGIATPKNTFLYENHFEGDRQSIRSLACKRALTLLKETLRPVQSA